MKRTLATIVLALSVACSLSAQDFSTFSKEDATVWISQHIRYCNYLTPTDGGQTVQQVLQSRKSNCVEASRLLLWILDSNDICVAHAVVVDTPAGRHMVVVTSLGEVLDPSTGRVYDEMPTGWKE